ncbi:MULTISPECIES: esterase/lipase family protein [unclassified Rhizobium]|uniref:esterase/lipase family protein n=1 Tax=unclassified Rhizobium TaxID=2613769 RepID=UPI002B25F9E5|nr:MULTISPECIES: alpha/beta fold hydrolase [unclassified Rhizobium]
MRPGQFELPKNKSSRESDTVVVFVHGLSGSAISTWRAMSKCFAEDTDFADIELDYYTYPTRLIRLPFTPPLPGIRDLADGFRTFLEERHCTKKKILIIAHSLGGVIARQMIVSALRSGHLANISKLALLASPSTGSQLANVGAMVSFAHGQLKALCKDEQGLAAINVDWEQMKIEENISVKYILGGSDRVVPSESASPYLGRDNKAVLINANHRSIVSPDDAEDIRYKTVKRFLLDQPLRATNAAATISPGVIRPADPLFDVYTPKEDAYYLVRSFDNVLSSVLSSGHVWLTGESGIGKSASARRAVFSNGWKLFHINLSSHEIHSPHKLIGAITSEISSITGESLIAESAPLSEQMSSLKRALLAARSDQIITEVVEEMPIKEEHLGESANLVAQLLEHVDTDERLFGQIRFIFSSRNSPQNVSGGLKNKTREKLQFLPVETWTQGDITRLVQLLAPAIRPNLSSAEQQYISAASGGSPRFVKMMFRHWRNGTSNSSSIEALCHQVSKELVI